MRDQCDYPKCFLTMQIIIHRGNKSVQLCDLHASLLLSDNAKMVKKTEKILKLMPVETIYRVNDAPVQKVREAPDDIQAILARLNNGDLDMCPMCPEDPESCGNSET